MAKPFGHDVSDLDMRISLLPIQWSTESYLLSGTARRVGLHDGRPKVSSVLRKG